MTSTELATDKYAISIIPIVKIPDLETFSALMALKIRGDSLGYARVEFLATNNIIASTYGKYSIEGVNFTQAILDEHKAERDHDR